jgi:hypothetical protein
MGAKTIDQAANVALVRERIEAGKLAEVMKATGLTAACLRAFALGGPARLSTIAKLDDWAAEERR